jgi:hypothetical protein
LLGEVEATKKNEKKYNFEVSQHGGVPQIIYLMGFYIINYPAIGVPPIAGNLHLPFCKNTKRCAAQSPLNVGHVPNR